MIVDTHCHAGINWFEPLEMLLAQLELNNVQRAVLIQHYGSGNEYIFDCLKKYPNKLSVVPIIKWNNKKMRQAEEVKKNGASGIRIYLDYEDLFLSSGIEFCKFLGDLNLVASVAGTLDQFSSLGFKKLVENARSTNFIIEHLAGVGEYSTSENSDVNCEGLLKYSSVLDLSRFENLFIKIPGLGELNNRPYPLSNDMPFDFDSNNLIKMTLDSFGSNHMMWGSDFPPVSNREGYRSALEGVKKLKIFTEQDRENIFNLVPMELFF
ncbi:MAG: hypothetical protein CL762_01165 [Chloroflexi bacterium]|nr:hypothetical protein [Chloroflexota bacterium]|tara:strand:- start:13263 stop:14060 length:798 start_codon:yes stop_codon:yes gene_type:complete